MGAQGEGLLGFRGCREVLASGPFLIKSPGPKAAFCPWAFGGELSRLVVES